MERINWHIVGRLAFVAILAALALVLTHTHPAAGFLVAAGFPIIPKSYNELQRAAYPERAGIPETIPWWFFDTQAYLAAGSSADIVFFAGVQADDTLGNFPTAGQLPDPMYFAIHHVMADIFAQDAPFVTDTADNTGQLDNVGLITQIGRPIITLRLSQKDYGQFPFSLCHGTGGPTGGIQSPTVAGGSEQWANNGVFDGGLRIDGAILIPPKTDFRIRVRLGVAVTPTTDQYIRITMGGVLYRAVK